MNSTLHPTMVASEDGTGFYAAVIARPRRLPWLLPRRRGTQIDFAQYWDTETDALAFAAMWADLLSQGEGPAQ